MPTAVRRTRKDPRREATRAALIEKAETMFADAGIDGVSLRQIGTAIGSANTNVVAYHFGGKEALIEAIFKHRLPALEARRVELLTVAEHAGRGRDLPTLMRTLWLPLFEQVNDEGRHSYAGFLGAISRSNWDLTRAVFDDSFPVSVDIGRRIAAAMPKSADRFFNARMQIAAAMIITVLQRIDQLHKQGGHERPDTLFADALSMATAAVAAPAE